MISHSWRNWHDSCMCIWTVSLISFCPSQKMNCTDVARREVVMSYDIWGCLDSEDVGCGIYTFQRDTQCSCTDCLLILRCQLYMFRTITAHPQELLFRCCMCRHGMCWYIPLVQRLRKNCSSLNVVPAGRISMYHSLHIQHLKRSSWGWTVTVRNT